MEYKLQHEKCLEASVGVLWPLPAAVRQWVRSSF